MSPAAPLIDELSLQHRQTSFYYSSGRALHCTSHRRAPPHETHLIDEPTSILQTDGLHHSVLIDELSLQYRQTSSYYSSGQALHCTSHRRAPPHETHLIDEPASILQTDGLHHSVLIDELSLQHRQTSSYYSSGRALHCTSHRRAPPHETHLIDEPTSILQTDGLHHSVLIDELSLQHRQTSSYYSSGRALHYTSHRRAPPHKTNLIDELSLQHRQTSSYYSSGRALHCTSHRRAPPHETHLIDEPVSILQTDGLHHSVLIDELSLQHRQASSYYSSGRALHCTSHRRAPPHETHLIDEPTSILQTDGLHHSVLIDELSLQYRQTSSYYSSGRALHCTSHRRAPPHETHLIDEPTSILQIDGLHHSILIDELSLQYRQTSSYYSSGRALHCTSHRRAPPHETHLIDEPTSILQIDGLHHSVLINELSLQHKQTSSYYSSGRALHCTSHRRAPPHETHLTDEPISILQADGLPHSVLIDELSFQHRQTSSYYL